MPIAMPIVCAACVSFAFLCSARLVAARVIPSTVIARTGHAVAARSTCSRSAASGLDRTRAPPRHATERQWGLRNNIERRLGTDSDLLRHAWDSLVWAVRWWAVPWWMRALMSSASASSWCLERSRRSKDRGTSIQALVAGACAPGGFFTILGCMPLGVRGSNAQIRCHADGHTCSIWGRVVERTPESESTMAALTAGGSPAAILTV